MIRVSRSAAVSWAKPWSEEAGADALNGRPALPMKLAFRLGVVAVVVALGFLAWAWLFPSPEQVIRHNLARIAELGSYSPGGGNIALISRVRSLGSYFAEDAQITAAGPGMDVLAINGRQELMQLALGTARSTDRPVKARFHDINPVVAPDQLSALVDCELEVILKGQQDELIAQELKFTIKKINGTWLITRVEQVKTLR